MMTFWDDLFDRLKRDLPNTRWFQGKSRKIKDVQPIDSALFDDYFRLLIFRVDFESGPSETYFFPVSVADPGGTPLLLTAKSQFSELDALNHAEFNLKLAESGQNEKKFKGERGEFRIQPTKTIPIPKGAGVRSLGTEQSNSSVIVGDTLIFKAYRRVEPGVNPEVEVLEHLQNFGPAPVPTLSFYLTYNSSDLGEFCLGMAQGFIQSRGDGWSIITQALAHLIDRFKNNGMSSELDGDLMGLNAMFRSLGKNLGVVHNALAQVDENHLFGTEKADLSDVDRWSADVEKIWARAEKFYSNQLSKNNSFEKLTTVFLPNSPVLAKQKDNLMKAVKAGFNKIRIHGDFHLGQTLRTRDNWVLFDFEGEPLRSLDERRLRHCAMKDVAGAIRSIDYALKFVCRRAGNDRIEQNSQRWLEEWKVQGRNEFLAGYFETISSELNFVPLSPEIREALLSFFEFEKALYEFCYEADNRPDWLEIPAAALSISGGL